MEFLMVVERVDKKAASMVQTMVYWKVVMMAWIKVASMVA